MTLSTLGLGAYSSGPARPTRVNHQRRARRRSHAFVGDRCAYCCCLRSWPLASMACPAANAASAVGWAELKLAPEAHCKPHLADGVIHYPAGAPLSAVGYFVAHELGHVSGDEWRVSYRLTISRKGTVLFDRSYTSLEAAVLHLPWAQRTMLEGGDGFDEKAWSERIDADKRTCAQVGCAAPATVFYRFKETFAKNGQGPLPDEGVVSYRTGFCSRHSERGDCGREDADRNYEVIGGKPASAREADRKPASFGGTITIGKGRS